ncbi:uncharacterized protein METZ01_LOCUS200166 [marine metagenome]|uniref:Uncharacterized protein n=1 Tax=marine metagenome TaxID=408172 RepID=A0A382EAF3_9ZZZZ
MLGQISQLSILNEAICKSDNTRKTYYLPMMSTSSSLCSVVLTPFLMLIDALNKFRRRFFWLFRLLLGFDHNGPSIL